MGKVKLPIKKIENKTSRQVTFSKRRNGLIKKAYELSVLCDTDVSLVMFSPSNRLSHFSGRRRIEDLLERYINLPDHERESELNVDKAFLASAVNRLRCEGDGPVPQANSGAPNPIVEKLQQEIAEGQDKLQLYKNTISLFEPNPRETPSFPSMDSLHACEEFLRQSLARVTHKRDLIMADFIMTNSMFVNEQSCQQPKKQGILDHFRYDLPPSDRITFSNQDLPMQTAAETFMSFRDQVTCDPSNFQMDPQPGQWQQMIMAPTLPLQQTLLGMPTLLSPEGAMMNYCQTAPSTMPQFQSRENVLLPGCSGHAATAVRGGSDVPTAVVGVSNAPTVVSGRRDALSGCN